SLRLLNCPFCGGELNCDRSAPSGASSDYGVLACHCGRYPIVAGIPIIKKGTIGNQGQDAHEVIDLIEAGRQRGARIAMVLPRPPLSVMNAPTSVQASHAWRAHAEAVFSMPHDQVTVCDLVDFFYTHSALSDTDHRQVERTDLGHYFLYRFSQPRYPIAL